MPVDEYLPHYTYDDWLHWEGRREIIDGRPIAGNPLPSPLHQRVAAVLQEEFGVALKKNRKC